MKQRIPELDGLRAIAVTLVVFFHLNFYYGHVPILTELIMNGGSLGVTLFFFLSGFLMASPYVSCAQEHRLYSFSAFYRARFLRILPLLFFTSFLFLLLRKYHHLYQDDSQDYSLTTYLSCLLLLDDRMIRWNPVLWTLRVELLFYIGYPLLGYLIYWGVSKNKMVWVYLILLVCIVSSFSLFILKYQAETSFFASCHMLFLGSLNRLWYAEYVKREVGPRKPFNVWMGSIVFFILFFSYLKHHSEYKMLSGVVLVLLLNAAFYVVLIGKGYVNKFLSFGIFGFISLISYSIYLWHFNVHYSLSVPLLPPSTIICMLFGHVFSLLVIILISILSYRYIEAPFLRLK